MASVTFKRGTKAEIESTQIQDGQLLMETDQLNNNKIYLDLPNGTRVPVGGSGAWVGTKKEFEVAVEEGKIADGTQVIITDDYESGITASMTLYSNAQSGLVATNVQSAIDEVVEDINTLNSNLSSMNYSMYSELRQLGIYYSENLTTEYIISKMSESSILITAVWRSSLPNLHYPNATKNDRCIYIIIKPSEGYVLIKHFEVDTGNMYICGYRDNMFSDWHSI